MKFLIASDLHDEFFHESDSYIKNHLKFAKADVLLLAGDITTNIVAHRLRNLQLLTYVVLGNHEFYHSGWDRALEDYKNLYKDSNIHILEDEMVIIPETNVRLIVASLWTDFWAPTLIGKEHQGNNCSKGMNDFTVIRGLFINKWEERHQKSLKFIKKCLSTKHLGPTIVMTHHAPSFKSNPEEFKNSSIRGGFCSDLEYIIEDHQPDFWIHGHCHNSSDYTIGKTRVICNPKGYPGEGNPDFISNLTIEV